MDCWQQDGISYHPLCPDIGKCEVEGGDIAIMSLCPVDRLQMFGETSVNSCGCEIFGEEEQ
jgi:hypothetical protein